MKSRSLFIPLFFLFAHYVSNADVYFLPRSEQDLPSSTKKTDMVFVPNARVAYFNRHALERDFPFLINKADAVIEKWILDNCSYVSEFQLRLDGIRQTPIAIEGTNKKIGYRQIGWARAASVMVTDDSQRNIGFVDVKGVGFADINDRIADDVASQIEKFATAHANQVMLDELRTNSNSGLVSFSEAIADVVNAEALQKIFDERRKNKTCFYETVENYFVVVMPFQILRDGTTMQTAALVGRQAHVGRMVDNRRIKNKIYIDPTGAKQFDSLGTCSDVNGVFPTGLEFKKQFLTTEQSVACDDGYFDRDLFDPRNSLERGRATKVATSFLDGDANAVYQHVQEMVGPPRERIAHQRVAFRTEFLSTNLFYDDIAKLVVIAPHDEVDYYVQLLRSSNASFTRAAIMAITDRKLHGPQIDAALQAALVDDENSSLIPFIKQALDR